MEHPIHTKFNILDCMLNIKVITKNYLDWITGSGTSHTSQIGILGSWVLATFDSHQIWYLGLCSNYKCDYRKLSWSVNRIRYLPYKSNRYAGVLGTWNFRFTPNLIFGLVYWLLMWLPKTILIGQWDPLPSIQDKSIYCGLGHMEGLGHTKLDF